MACSSSRRRRGLRHEPHRLERVVQRLRLRRRGQLHPPGRGPDLPAGHRHQRAVLADGPGLPDRAVPGARAAAGPQHADQRRAARAVLPAHRGRGGVGRARVDPDVRPQLRGPQRRPGRAGAGRPRPVVAGRHLGRGLQPGAGAVLAAHRSGHDHLHRRPPGDPARPLRGRGDRRGDQGPDLPLHHLAAAGTRGGHRRRLHDHPDLQGVRPGHHADRRRVQHRDHLDLDLSHGVPVLPVRLRRGGLGGVPDHPRRADLLQFRILRVDQ